VIGYVRLASDTSLFTSGSATINNSYKAAAGGTNDALVGYCPASDSHPVFLILSRFTGDSSQRPRRMSSPLCVTAMSVMRAS